MSALDQAFIKAYSKDGPAPAELGAALAASKLRVGASARPATSPVESSAAAPLIENLYADGALYRIEVPSQTDAPVPQPHYAPPASQHRTTQRRVAGRHRTDFEPAEPSTTSRPEAAPPARRMPIRSLSEVARRLAHYLPPAPTADLPPEVLIVDEPAALPIELPPPPTIAPPPAAPAALPSENKLASAAAKPVVATTAAIDSMPPASEDVATLVEVCTPWEPINDAASASMVILAESPFLPTLPLAPQVELALDPLGTAAEPSANSEPVKRTYRVDPRKPQAIDAPHFAADRDPTESAQPSTSPPAADLPGVPRVELTPEEMASLIGTPAERTAHAAPATMVEPATATVAPPLVPMWEVDRFQWPVVCERLLKDERSYFAQAGGKLLAAAKDGLKTLGITGSRRGEGRTTLALCLARCAAQSGLNVAMIDADFTRPQLASVIGLEVAYGWQDAAQGKIPLAEAAVRSLADKITVLPLEPSSVAWPLALADKRVSSMFRAVAQTHDLVIIDLGPLSGGGDPIFASDEPAPLDAAIVLRDLRYATTAETQTIGERLHASGVEAIGIAENFVPAEQASVA